MNILFAFQISMCDKSRNTWLCVHWQWNTLEWCQLNALQASPVVHLVTPLSCVSLSMNTQPSVPTIETAAHTLDISCYVYVGYLHVRIFLSSQMCFTIASVDIFIQAELSWNRISWHLIRDWFIDLYHDPLSIWFCPMTMPTVDLFWLSYGSIE